MDYSSINTLNSINMKDFDFLEDNNNFNSKLKDNKRSTVKGISNISISNKGSGKDSIEHFDDYLTNRQKINTNTIRIYDVTRS